METTGFKVIEFGLITSYSNQWLGYSPDGIAVNDNGPVALLEIKCPYEGLFSLTSNYCKYINLFYRW